MVAIFAKYSWAYLPCLRERNQSIVPCSDPQGEEDKGLFYTSTQPEGVGAGAHHPAP